MRLFFLKKSKAGKVPEQSPDEKLEHFRKLLLDHLDTLGGDDVMSKGGKALPVGTVRDRKGGFKYIKIAPNKWVKKYDSQSRGAKMAVVAIRRKVAAAKDAREMMQIILQHRDRFSDKEGHPLPFVMELHNYIMSEQDSREKAQQEKAPAGEKANEDGSGEGQPKQKRNVYDPGKPKRGQAAAARRKEAKEKPGSDEDYKKWEQRGADAFKAGKPAKPPYDEIVKPGIKIGSPESKEASKIMAAWLQGWIKADASDESWKNHEKKQGNDKENAKEKISPEQQAEAKKKLEDLAVPMMEVEYSKDEYNRLFPDGTVKTPIKTVKMGSDQFAKLGRKDSGGRQSYIGAAYQTLTDPIVVIKEGNDDVYIKSFTGKDGISTFMSVEKDKGDGRFVVTNYKRNKKEIFKKIKRADSIAYIADDRGSPASMDKEGIPHADSSHTSTVSPDSGEKSSDFDKIQKKYKNAQFEEGDEDEIQVGKELIPGKWKLVEADTPTASHDETTFHKTPGFPTTDDGSTINDRDYGHDKEAQGMVMEIGADYDGRAVSVDNPVVVTKDGIVISGNNRTMSGKIAARKGTDEGYIETLKKKAKKFGFTAGQIDQFKHPRVIFETAENKGYTTDQFAKFNKSSKKAMSPIESAVKVSKTIKTETVESIAEKISDFETLGELYSNRNAINDIFNTLQRDNIITSMDRPQYVSEGGITGAGKEFLETVLIGSVINESNIRGLNREGCKSIRQKLVRAITPLIENKGMDGYGITKELNEAVDIAMQVATQKDKFKNVNDYTNQKNLFGIEDDPVSVEIARKLEGTQKEFAEFMQTMNGGLKYAANGEADIFLGGVESREDILARMLTLKKSIEKAVDGALRFFAGLWHGRGSFEREKVILNRAGETVEDYRWVAKRPDVQLALEKQAVAPHAELVKDPLGGEKTIAVDFDGVINSYKSGWQGPTKTDEPVLSAAEGISGLWNRGYKIVIFSTRASTPEGADTIREYIRKHTENEILANSIEITDRKPVADVYVDDRAIPFTGNWEETLKQIEEFKPWMEKSLTYSGFPLQGRAKVQGMDISIENKKGSTRSGTDKDGHEWHTKMHYDYGYIRGTVGVDKDHLDAYIGPSPESEIVYIVNQNDPVTGKFDEQKVMLGFNSEAEAKAAYLKQYDRPGFFGDIVKMDIDTFKEEAFNPGNKGKPLKRREN